jgi:hypothetical protein
MTPSRPTIRNCPICRIAMVSSRSRPDSAAFDTFQCLSCDTVIRIDIPHGGGDDERKRND